MVFLHLVDRQVIFFILLFITFLTYRGSDRLVVLSMRVYPPLVQQLPVVIPSPFPYPKAAREAATPKISAKAAVVTDITTAAVLFTQNPKLKLKPASITKIMTALVALERCPLERIARVKTLDTDDTNTQMGLREGEQITIEALLYGLLLNSGNDAAIALSENCADSTSHFVNLMNEKAQALHLTDTHFVNPSGLEHPEHYTTAWDLARLTAAALRNPDFARMVSTKEIVMSNTTKTIWHTLTNKNLLLGKVSNVIGVKTGWTEEAGECLVVALRHDENTLVSVVLGSNDRFKESEQLLQWALTRYSWEPVSS